MYTIDGSRTRRCSECGSAASLTFSLGGVRTRMNNRRVIMVAAVAVALLAVAFVFTHSAFRDPRSRIEHEHGLRLPTSASEFECRGDAARGFLDRGAASAFTVATNDLAGFLAQLTVRTSLQTFIPGNSQYQLHAAWRRGSPLATYSCASAVGDWLHVEVWPIDSTRVGVSLYTDWN